MVKSRSLSGFCRGVDSSSGHFAADLSEFIGLFDRFIILPKFNTHIFLLFRLFHSFFAVFVNIRLHEERRRTLRPEFWQLRRKITFLCVPIRTLPLSTMHLPTLLLLLMQRNAKSKHCVRLVLMPHIIDRIHIECDYRWHNYTNHKYAANDRCTGQRRTVLASLHDCCAEFCLSTRHYLSAATCVLSIVFNFSLLGDGLNQTTAHTHTHTHQHCARSALLPSPALRTVRNLYYISKCLPIWSARVLCARMCDFTRKRTVYDSFTVAPHTPYLCIIRFGRCSAFLIRFASADHSLAHKRAHTHPFAQFIVGRRCKLNGIASFEPLKWTPSNGKLESVRN